MEADHQPAARPGVRLAVDVGDVRVGVAATDPDALLATPVMTLRRDSRRGSDLRMLSRIIADRAVTVVYVGLPLSLSGEHTASTVKAQQYAQALADRLAASSTPQTQVRLVDERLSTVSAAQKMRDSGVDSRAGRETIDQAAAVEILEHALQMRRARAQEPGDVVVPHHEEDTSP
ncbi:Holliday junction resolvase RuvX [Nesterenkonia aerolata]|uniref:Putative pre-16S rRNA nuclease n=1 Tax=Nesterenkonia aerolata TaxID=3074079 RepID=A0ABU2DRN5_9MICC|nr:Holliday junction resolvase RuvX [Nesterenkonia sp. LY-0111]MDR8019159.1 Holliday junction resolvase RuvX [Nesterenkonia sp. LY-0111]